MAKSSDLRMRFGVLGRIRLHPLFVLLALLAVGVGLWRELVVLFLLVMLHELGHAAVATHYGYEVEEVSLLPFGGVASISYGSIGFSPRHEGAIAIAGPLVNLALVVLALVLGGVGIWPVSFVHQVTQLNVWIAVFNLLPGLPLDGGRVLRAARSRGLGYEAATLEAYKVSIWISVFLLGLGGVALWSGYPHLGILVLGAFLFISAWTGRRQMAGDTIRFLDAKRRQHAGFERPSVVRALAVGQATRLREVVRQFAPERYHLVYVLDEAGNVQTIVEESELLEVVFAG
ncbi:MAG: peptidase M50, partial [Alicyclobacillus sp. RIFOXYA1_FULL_53_8]